MGCSKTWLRRSGIVTLAGAWMYACGAGPGSSPMRNASGNMSTGGVLSTGGLAGTGGVSNPMSGGLVAATGGNSAACTAGCPGVDECASAELNNCGAATCMDMEPGFECICGDGLTFRDGECVCDLVGTYAVRSVAPLSWQESRFALDVVIAAGMADSLGYGLLRITRDGTNLTAHSQGCGTENPDLCSPYYMEAFGQSVPESIWDGPNMPIADMSMSATSEAPGGTFTMPQTASFLGLRMAAGVDPLGGFPDTATDPSLTWLDDDGDGQPGVTSFVVPPGGTSTSCSYPYAYFPVDAVTGARAQSFNIGARTISHIEGTITDCNTMSGQVLTDMVNGRVYGCTLDSGTACSASQAKFVDGNSGGQSIGPAPFVMVRLNNDNATCVDARAATFPN